MNTINNTMALAQNYAVLCVGSGTTYHTI